MIGLNLFILLNMQSMQQTVFKNIGQSTIYNYD